MNERIRELARKAGVGILYDYDGYDGHAGVANLADIEKFAQLIVRECMNITDQCHTGEGIHSLHADEIIAEHFGVEL